MVWRIDWILLPYPKLNVPYIVVPTLVEKLYCLKEAIPFAYFPTTQNNESGFIFPTIGESNDRGYYLQNGGYYLPLSKYYDLNILGDYYTNGSYGLRFDTQYRVNYKFRGRFSYRYEKLI